MGPIKAKDGTLKDDDKENAGILNTQFQSVFIKPTSKSCNSSIRAENAKIDMDDMHFYDGEVYWKLHNLRPKTSSGVSGVSNKMLKEAAQQLTRPLTNLFNWCMEAS